MILTTRGRYAVMAIVDLALKEHGDTPCRLATIAASQKIDLAYLEQIFNALKNAELVKSYRGPNGGYKLASSPENIKIIDIIRAVNEPIDMTRCKTEGSCMGEQGGARCRTHKLWSGLTKNIEDFLGSQTVASIIDEEEIDEKHLNILEA